MLMIYTNTMCTLLRQLHNWLALMACLLTAACATLPSEKTTPPLLSKTARLQTLSHIQTFHLVGVLAIRTPHDAGSLHWQWQQKKSRRYYTLTLQGPLGTGSVHLEGQGQKVMLQKADGKIVFANNPDQLLLQETGWRLPVSGFYYWVRSLPVPGTAAEKTFDTQNRLSLLKQQGWTIQYLHYTNVNGLDLPDKMSLTTSSVSLKVVVSRWDF